jgi:hypothetical protein
MEVLQIRGISLFLCIGEILVRSNSVTTGYYKRPDLNNDRSIFIGSARVMWVNSMRMEHCQSLTGSRISSNYKEDRCVFLFYI